jgi:glycogen operon protein
MMLSGEATDETDARGRPIRGDTVLLLLNSSDAPIDFALPEQPMAGRWATLVDTSTIEPRAPDDSEIALAPHALVLLRFVAT